MKRNKCNTTLSHKHTTMMQIQDNTRSIIEEETKVLGEKPLHNPPSRN